MSDLTIPESGFARITLGGKTVEAVDLYAANNRLVALRATAQEHFPAPEQLALRTESHLESIVDYLETLGFGRVSHFVADKFEESIFKAVDEMGKDPAPEQTRG